MQTYYQPSEWEFKQALMTPEEWYNSHGKEWFDSELETAEMQRNGLNGLLGGGTKEMGDFREKQARQIYSLGPVKFSNYITQHRICIMDSLKFNQPVSAIAVDEYNKERGIIHIPDNYIKSGNHYVPKNENLSLSKV